VSQSRRHRAIYSCPRPADLKVLKAGSYVTLYIGGSCGFAPGPEARRRLAASEASGPVAQRLEQGTHNPLVGGSNPSGPTTSLPCPIHIPTCSSSADVAASGYGPRVRRLKIGSSSGSGFRVAGVFDEGAHLLWIFVAGGGFHSGCYVDTPGGELADGFGDVRWVEAAGGDHLHLRGAEQ
jgi:hypothetical protein